MAEDQWAKVGRYFDGISQYFEVPGPILSREATVEGWFVWLSGKAALVRDGSIDGGWSLGHDVNGHLAYRVAGVDRTTAVRTEDLRQRWHHFVLVKNAAAVAYYLDGEAVDRWEGAPDTAAVMPWRAMRDGPNDALIEGFAADIAMYEHPLAADSVKTHWEAGRARF